MQSYRCIIFRGNLLPHSVTWNLGNDEAWLPFSHWAENLEFAFQRYLPLETTPLWRKPQLMWPRSCPPWAALALSRGHQSHLYVTQPSVSVPFRAFCFSCVSDTYSLFSGVCLSFYFSSKEQKEWKGYVRAHQSSAFPAYFVPCALTRLQRTRLAQRLLEQYHCQRKTTMMWYPCTWFGVSVMVILSLCLGFLLELSGFRRNLKSEQHTNWEFKRKDLWRESRGKPKGQSCLFVSSKWCCRDVGSSSGLGWFHCAWSLAWLLSLATPHLSPCKPPEDRDEDSRVWCSWSGHTEWFRQLHEPTRARKTGQPQEKVSEIGAFWGCSSECITAACSAFLASLEAVGTGTQDNPEYFHFC